jgi:hypothetical protein
MLAAHRAQLDPTITADFAPLFSLAFRHIRRPLKGLADLANWPGHFKVQVVVQCATRIEARPARRTCRLTIQVPLSAARAAQHRLLIELSLRPNPGGMIGLQFVTVEAGIEGPAAVEFLPQ